MYYIYLVTKVFFVFTKKIKDFKTTSKLSLFLVSVYQSRWLLAVAHSFQQMSVFSFAERYVLVEGFAKLDRPNKDIVHV